MKWIFFKKKESKNVTKIEHFRTFFLTGPVRQLKKMFEKGRFIATLVFITLIAFSLIAALFLSSPFLAFILVVGEYIAMLWYSISYIPYAR